MHWRRGSVAAAATAILVVTLPSAPAMALEVVGDWRMEESPGDTTMVNSAGDFLHGQIGSDVVLGEATPAGTKAYRFRGDWWIVNDERLVQVPDDNPDPDDVSRLDPGRDPYAVTIRFKTGAHDPNIIQKGQSETSGGMWKLVLKKGWPRCHFRDENHVTKAIGFVNSTDPETKVDDNTWHTLRCERTATGVRVTIDPDTPEQRTKFIKGTLGDIDNDFPLTIGGKLACNFTDVTCDYMAGPIDWVRIES